jgi:hypothetical protein
VSGFRQHGATSPCPHVQIFTHNPLNLCSPRGKVPHLPGQHLRHPYCHYRFCPRRPSPPPGPQPSTAVGDRAVGSAARDRVGRPCCRVGSVGHPRRRGCRLAPPAKQAKLPRGCFIPFLLVTCFELLLDSSDDGSRFGRRDPIQRRESSIGLWKRLVQRQRRSICCGGP